MTFKDGVYLTLIAILSGLLVFQYITKPVCPVYTNSSKTDTFYTKKDTVKVSYPTYLTVKGRTDTVKSLEYVKNTGNIDSIKSYYASLYTEYNEKRVITDSLYQDSSYVKLWDTVSQNLIQGRTYKFHLSYPRITTTNTSVVTLQPQTEFYWGMQLLGNKTYPLYGLNGVILVNRKNSIFGVSLGTDIQKSLNIGVLFTQKIK